MPTLRVGTRIRMLCVHLIGAERRGGSFPSRAWERVKRAEKQLSKFDETTRDRIFKELFKLRDKAQNITLKKRKSKAGEMTLRVGRYRIAIEMDEMNQIINVLKVKHRREAFRD